MAISSWRKIRFELYKTLRKQAENFLGESDPEIKAYKKSYEKDIQRPWVISSLKQLLVQVEKSQLILMGDFHSLHQSQKGHLRILRILPKKREKVLFVEFIRHQDQKYLDNYIQGKLTDEEFLNLVKWEESWGFSWRSYKPILVWAKRKNVPVIAIDKVLKTHGDSSLKERDEFAAYKMKEVLEKKPGVLGILIIGDYHIGSQNLPKILKQNRTKPFKILRIFLNSENIYLDLLDKGLEFETDVVQFTANDFGLVSVAPWVKWHSLVMHLESQFEGDFEIASSLQEEVSRLLAILENDLGTSFLDESLKVYTLSDLSFESKLNEILNDVERARVERYIRLGYCFLIPQIKSIFIPKPSLNFAAEGAMAIWHYSQSPYSRSLMGYHGNIYKMIWLHFIYYFGSKLINPKRKTDTVYDIKNRVKNKSSKKSLKAILDLKHQESLWLSGLKEKPLQFKISEEIEPEVAFAIGAMLAEKFYFLYRKGHLNFEQMLTYIKAPESKWVDNYFEILAIMAPFPDPFFSKRLKV